MAIDRTGIDSLNAGAPDLRLTGDMRMTQNLSPQLERIIKQYWIQQGGSPMDRIQDIPNEFKDKIIQLFQQSRGDTQMPSSPERSMSAYGGTARPTYTQSRKQRMAYGGIAGLDGRMKYGIGSWFQENVMDPIKGTADKLIPNELKDNPLLTAALIGGSTKFLPEGYGQGWLGDLLERAEDIPYIGPIAEGLGKAGEVISDVGGTVRDLPGIFKEDADWGDVLSGITESLKGGDDPGIARQIANIGIPLEVGRRMHDYQAD